MVDYTKPVLPGTAPSDYERYLRTDELLALQKPAGDRVHRDELLFQVVHQTSELWLKLATEHVEDAATLTRAGELDAAVRLLRRASPCLLAITDALRMLEHMSPWEYQQIRKVLGHGSGFDSPGFRRVHEVTPLLGAAFDHQLRDRGLTLTDLYQHGRDHESLYQLGEQLIEWDERTILWRFHHVKMVERVIGGHVIGTQGTPVEVLGKRVNVPFFPELWAVRNELTQLAGPID